MLHVAMKWNFLYKQVLNLPTVSQLQVTCPTVKNYNSSFVVKNMLIMVFALLLSQPHIHLLLIQVLKPLVVGYLLWAMKPVAQNLTVSDCDLWVCVYWAILWVYSLLWVVLVMQITSAMFIFITCRYICTYWIKTYWIEKYWSHWEFDADFKLWNLLPQTSK